MLKSQFDHSIDHLSEKSTFFMKKTNFQQPISVFEERQSTTSKLISAAIKHKEITNKIRSHLPVELAEHCEFGSIKGSSMIIFSDSAAWATRLRFHSNELVRYLNQEYKYSLTSIKFKIAPIKGKRKKPKPQPFHIDKENINSIRQLSYSVTNEELGDALAHLADVIEKKSEP